MDSITIVKPDDWHVHLRDGDMLKETVPSTERCFNRAIVMPNLVPPVTNHKLALEYKSRIMEQSQSKTFEPLMTLYLTDQTTPEEIHLSKKSGVTAGKLYPAGATTNSKAGIQDIEDLFPVFKAMSESGMLLLIHGEVTDHDVDIFDREKMFIDRYMKKIVKTFPDLKVVFEHITTKEAVDFVTEGPKNIAATITPQHLIYNRNDMLVGGIKPHNYCLPILKRNIHQKALQDAALSGSPKFFLGTDSAPHEKSTKESACGCAGCYSAPASIELYAHVFDELGGIDKLEGFASLFGPDFYGLPRNKETITLVKETWTVPESLSLGGADTIVPFYSGLPVNWRLTSN